MYVSKKSRTLISLIGASLVALVTCQVAAQASAEHPVGASARSPAVTAAGSTRTASIAGISCTASSRCTVSVTVTEGDADRPILGGELWNGSSWSSQPMTAVKAVASGALSAVSCNSPDRCMAVGTFTVGDLSNPVAAGEYLDGKTWTLAVMPLPKDTTGGSVTAVSCAPSSFRCMAVGSFTEGDISRPLVLGELWDGKTWTLELIPVPKNATSGAVSDLSCPSPVSCVGIGTFTVGDLSNPVVVGEAWNGKSWTLHTVPLP
jgi:hypothetical protein